MSIYNRWGELMYFTDDINSFWDGKYKNQIVPEGAYSYLLMLMEKTLNTSQNGSYKCFTLNFY